MISKTKKNIIFSLGLVGLLLGGLYLINIPMELPPEHQGIFEVTGKVESCSFRSLTKNSSKFFLGIVLAGSEKIYRMNLKYKERYFYESLCKSKARVNIRYHAVQRLIGPIRFWVDSIEVR
ncbi:hypothetical protein BTJ40_08040 [Microbulbifer sp. A4B17]|nr:hypothetical protein BTJ40_08040 [Microbulbifer sp. A4B17]